MRPAVGSLTEFSPDSLSSLILLYTSDIQYKKTIIIQLDVSDRNVNITL